MKFKIFLALVISMGIFGLVMLSGAADKKQKPLPIVYIGR